MELIILYHGTKFKITANKILKDGFLAHTYFSRNLADAICMGGKYVFKVVFVKHEIPYNWQVRCANYIPQERIVSLIKYKRDIIKENKQLEKRIFESNIKLNYIQIDYYFNEFDANFHIEQIPNYKLEKIF